jgi:hypothetical protein
MERLKVYQLASLEDKTNHLSVVEQQLFMRRLEASMSSMSNDIRTLRLHVRDILREVESDYYDARDDTKTREVVEHQRSVNRLAFMGGILLPFSIVSGFFSMAEEWAPGGKRFFAYWAIAVPIMLSAVVLVYADTIRKRMVYTSVIEMDSGSSEDITTVYAKTHVTRYLGNRFVQRPRVGWIALNVLTLGIPYLLMRTKLTFRQEMSQASSRSLSRGTGDEETPPAIVEEHSHSPERRAGSPAARPSSMLHLPRTSASGGIRPPSVARIPSNGDSRSHSPPPVLLIGDHQTHIRNASLREGSGESHLSPQYSSQFRRRKGKRMVSRTEELGWLRAVGTLAGMKPRWSEKN